MNYQKCAVCSWDFLPRKPGETRCNLCRVSGAMQTAKAKRKKRAKNPTPLPPPPPRTCGICQREFQPTSVQASHQKYCSSIECQRENSRRRVQRSKERRQLAEMLQQADKQQQLSKQHMMDVKAEMRKRKGVRV